MRTAFYASAAAIVMAAVVSAEAGVISSVDFNTSTRHSYNGGWGGGATGWDGALHMSRTNANTTDSFDGNGAAQYTVTTSADPATTYWRGWFGLGWLGANNAEATADAANTMVSFDLKATNLIATNPMMRLSIRAFRSSAADGWAQLDAVSASKNFAISTEWAKYSFPLSDWAGIDFTTNRNYYVAELVMSADGGSGFAGFNATGVSSVFFDNMRIETVPEPTAAIMGLLIPVMALTRRRRAD